MPTTLQFQTDAGIAITTQNFGALGLNDNSAVKLQISNIGADNALSVIISLERTGASDGVTRVYLAPDASGSPGAYSQDSLAIGDMAPGDTFVFWAKVQIPAVDTPFGNPRQFKLEADFKGT